MIFYIVDELVGAIGASNHSKYYVSDHLMFELAQPTV